MDMKKALAVLALLLAAGGALYYFGGSGFLGKKGAPAEGELPDYKVLFFSDRTYEATMTVPYHWETETRAAGVVPLSGASLREFLRTDSYAEAPRLAGDEELAAYFDKNRGLYPNASAAPEEISYVGGGAPGQIDFQIVNGRAGELAAALKAKGGHEWGEATVLGKKAAVASDASGTKIYFIPIPDDRTLKLTAWRLAAGAPEPSAAELGWMLDTLQVRKSAVIPAEAVRPSGV